MSHGGSVITAWKLEDGLPVYLGADRSWVRELGAAHVFDEDTLGPALAWAQDRARETTVVDPYVMEVGPDRTPTGRRVREMIRAAGPTVRPDLAHGPSRLRS